MGSRFPSHKLSNGLYVSGRPEQLKERQPTMTSTAMPYTGGDIKKSGELGKMFDGSKSRKSGQLVTGPPGRSGSFGGAASYSGPLPNHPAARPGYQTSGPISSGAANPAMPPSRQKSNSGPLSRNGESLKKTSGPLSGTVTPGVARQNSGPLAPAIPATGLITSGPISSGPLNSSGAPKKVSGPIDSSAKLHSMSMQHNHSITNLSHDYDLSFWSNFPKCALWVVIPLFLIGLIAAVFILVAVKNAVFLIVMVVFLFAITLLITWNVCWGRRVVTGFVSGFEDAELRTARDGQFVKVSGVVTCGGVPLESSYQRVPRCVYTSIGLYEYRGWDSKAANSTHRRFTWGLRYLERRVVDFYISDFQSGLRALVKAGYGAKVTPYVEENTVIDINNNNKDLSSHFVRWLADRNLSSDDRTMRLKEGYIKEGSTVSVMGVVQRNENVLMIVPPSEPTSTRWQWLKCLLPASVEGIIIKCEDSSKNDAIPV